jgi:Na+/H+-dicarboxylate symporter
LIWFVGIQRAVTNLVGNCVAIVVIAFWGNDIDAARAQSVLNGEAEVSDSIGEVSSVAS